MIWTNLKRQKDNDNRNPNLVDKAFGLSNRDLSGNKIKLSNESTLQKS